MFREGTLEKLFKNMNSHVPAIRPSLEALLQMDEPSYSDKNGRTYIVSRDELLDLSSFVDKWELSRVKVPILLMTDPNYESGRWKVIGRVETKAISRILNREPEKEDEILIFYPQMMMLRKRFSTVTNCFYMP
ncbi:MAG: DUF61 family protein [Euryarchaeota archaeon]|nr:DUF61 family protein [Euryarchaeota archaeon]